MQRVEEREADLLNQLAERQAIDELQGRLAGVKEALAATVTELDRSTEADAQARAAEAAAREEWTRWKRDLDLPDDLSPQGVLDFFDGVRVAQEALLARDTIVRDIEEILARVGAWERRAGETLVAAGREPAMASERLIDQLVSLRQQIADDRETRRTLDGVEAEIADRTARVEFLDESLARLSSERDGIFAAAGATDEASYRQRADVALRRVALMDQIRDLEQQLDERLGGPDGDEIREALATGSEDHWRHASAAHEERIDDLQRQRDEAIARHRDAERERVTVESSADVARLETEFEGLRTELQSIVGDWQATSLASMLLQETLHQFERTRQPEVLATASTTFAYITKGRYIRVVQEEQGPGILVIDRDGGRRPAESLSRGTAEQLYLCIRFALAAEFGRRSEPLPIVMDDVFVNFDAERAESMAYVIAEFAQNHQVLLFTCHPATRDMLKRIVPGAGLVELATVEPAGLPSQARPFRLPAEPEPDAAPAATPRDTTTFDLLEGVPPLNERES
jgi:uncharacterized protein YhaN